MTKNDDTKTPWRAPTRRAFVGMVAAAAAALVVRKNRRPSGDRPRSPRTGKTLWIGHC